MTDIQELEIGRYRDELDEDVRKLVDKYLRIADWDIPENNEKKTVEIILWQIRKSLDDTARKWNLSDQ
jgi:hypothetical protein